MTKAKICAETQEKLWSYPRQKQAFADCTAPLAEGIRTAALCNLSPKIYPLGFKKFIWKLSLNESNRLVDTIISHIRK